VSLETYLAAAVRSLRGIERTTSRPAAVTSAAAVPGPP
jgi:hypothetical protein